MKTVGYAASFLPARVQTSLWRFVVALVNAEADSTTEERWGGGKRREEGKNSIDSSSGFGRSSKFDTLSKKKIENAKPFIKVVSSIIM